MSALQKYEILLKGVIRQRHSIIHIETDDYYTEEQRLKRIIESEIDGIKNSDINIWLPDIGKKRLYEGDVEGDSLCQSLRVLPDANDKFRSILIIRGLHYYFDMHSDSIAQISTLLYEFYARNEQLNVSSRSIIIIISPKFEIPIDLKLCIYTVNPPLPDEKDIEMELGLSGINDNDVNKFAKYGYKPEGKPYRFTKRFFKSRGKIVYEDNKRNLINALKGLRIHDINRLLFYGSTPYLIEGSDIESFEDRKKRMVQDSGLLTVENVPEYYSDFVGDIDGLKRYMIKEKGVIDNRVYYNKKMPLPKGILLVGPPGCGKSETSKAIASILRMPLYSMDMGKLLGSLMGQSEHNFDKALSIAEAAQPCVLRIDEIEKAFAGSGADQNEQTMTHIVGHFLTWMQERKSLVYLVATANDLEMLRPEFLRKGRWDEIYYLTYPSADGMKRIVESCLRKYGLRMADGEFFNQNDCDEDEDGNRILSSPIGKETKAIIDSFYKKNNSIKLSGAEIVDIIEQIYKSQFVSSPKSQESKVLSLELFKNKLIELSKKDRDVDLNRVINREILEIEINQMLKNKSDDKQIEERLKRMIEIKYNDNQVKRMIDSELYSLEINSILSGNSSKFDKNKIRSLLESKYDKNKLIHDELGELKISMLLNDEKHVKECQEELQCKLRDKYKNDHIEELYESRGYKSASKWPPKESR